MGLLMHPQWVQLYRPMANSWRDLHACRRRRVYNEKCWLQAPGNKVRLIIVYTYILYDAIIISSSSS
jgi:hypothetical protein